MRSMSRIPTRRRWSIPAIPCPAILPRVVGAVDEHGRFSFTKTNAYSRNNGRAAILDNTNGANVIYTAGNAGQRWKSSAHGIIVARAANHDRGTKAARGPAGPEGRADARRQFQHHGLGLTADKIGKDTNFRGLTISNDVIYTTKGSGGTVSTRSTLSIRPGSTRTGKPLACPNAVVSAGSNNATLPTTPIYYDATKLQTLGVVPYNCAS